MTFVLQALGILAAAFVVGTLVYTVGSYAVSAPHLQARGARRTIRAALGEFGWALLLSLIGPPHFAIGRRMGRGRGQVPVILVHGYTQNRSNFLRIARRLRTSGAGPLFGFNYPWMLTVDACAERLARFVEAVCAETGAARVDLVCHSMGGLVARALLAAGHAERVRSVATIGSPHRGVAWKGPIVGACGPQLRLESDYLVRLGEQRLPVPVLSIFSSHDNIAFPTRSSSLAGQGAADQEIRDVGHLTLLFTAEVCEAVARWIEAQPAAEALPAAATGTEGR